MKTIWEGRKPFGAEAMKFTFGAYYTLGLANLSTITDDGEKIQNKGFSICVGYKF